MTDQQAKGRHFRKLHAGGTFVMPNAWDAGSARLLAAAGFAAIGTTSAGIAYSMGRPDGAGRVSRRNEAPMKLRRAGDSHSGLRCTAAQVLRCGLSRTEMIDAVRRIAIAIDQPVSADLEAGFGATPEEVARTVRLAIGAGAVGCNIEDASGDAAAPLFDAGLAAERIRAAREAADATGIAFTLTARSDGYLVGSPEPFADSVRRACLYRDAGADCLFIPGAQDLPTIASLVAELDAPLSVVMGLRNTPVSVAELAAAGVRRISTGGSLARAALGLLRRAATEIREQGRFGYADGQIPDEELCRFFVHADDGAPANQQ